MKITAVAVLLCSAIALFGEAKDCINPSLIVPDGRIVTSQFAGSINGYTPTYWYGFYGQATHSYSVEFVPTVDNEDTSNAINFANLTVWGPTDIGALQINSCFGSTSVSWTSTQSAAPAIARSKYGSGQRLSFTAQVSGLYILSITNTQAAGSYSYRVVDTTMFGARWSTLSGYDSHWSFTNFSDIAITGILNIYESSGRLVMAAPVTLPAGGHTSHFTGPSDLNIQRNDAGYAVFSYNGPPQAILADSYMVNSDATVLIFVKFETRNFQ